MVEKSDTFDRRTVLKTATSAALFGLGTAATSGSASAAETKRRLAASYADESSLRTAFERHGDEVVAQLRDAGIVDESFDLGSVEFEVDGAVTGMEPSADDRLAGVTAASPDGTFTALGMLSTSSDSHEIALYVQPERGLAYARATPHDGGDTLKVTTDGVSPEGCAYTECESGCDSYDCYDQKNYYSCDSNCENCSIYDTDCSCCICDSC